VQLAATKHYATAADAAVADPNTDSPVTIERLERFTKPVSTTAPTATVPDAVTVFSAKPVYTGPTPASRAPPLPMLSSGCALYGTVGAIPSSFAVDLPPPIQVSIDVVAAVPSGRVTPGV